MTLRVFFDLDGTLCHTPEDIDHDDVRALIDRCTPREQAIAKVRELHALGHQLGIITGRGPHVRAATTAQLHAWLPEIAADIIVHHRPRLVFDWHHYIGDKEHVMRLEAVDVYVGDRAEDKAAALRAGARFVWDHTFEAHGLTGLRQVVA